MQIQSKMPKKGWMLKVLLILWTYSQFELKVESAEPALNLGQANQSEIEKWQKKEKYWAQTMYYELLQQSS